MAYIRFKGLEEYERKLSQLERAYREQIAGKAIYEGAGLVADAIRSGIDGLPSKSGVTKQGLRDGFGITHLKDDKGYLNVKIGFDGYNAKGVPNVLMARLFESGKSHVQKHPFVRPAINRTKKEAEETMAEVIDEEIQKLMD